MAEHDGLTFAPVLIKDLDAVFGRYRTHGYLLHGNSALDADIHKFGKRGCIDEKLAPPCVMSGRQNAVVPEWVAPTSSPVSLRGLLTIAVMRSSVELTQ
jgi:hypothetical protein